MPTVVRVTWQGVSAATRDLLLETLATVRRGNDEDVRENVPPQRDNKTKPPHPNRE